MRECVCACVGVSSNYIIHDSKCRAAHPTREALIKLSPSSAPPRLRPMGHACRVRACVRQHGADVRVLDSIAAWELPCVRDGRHLERPVLDRTAPLEVNFTTARVFPGQLNGDVDVGGVACTTTSAGTSSCLFGGSGWSMWTMVTEQPTIPFRAASKIEGRGCSGLTYGPSLSLTLFETGSGSRYDDRPQTSAL